MLIKGVNGHKCLAGVMCNYGFGQTKVVFKNGIVITLPKEALKKDGNFKLAWKTRIKEDITIKEAEWIAQRGGRVELITQRVA